MKFAAFLVGLLLLVSTPKSHGYCESSLHCPILDAQTHGPEISHNLCKCRCEGISELAIEDLFKSAANCVRIKAEGDAKNPGGYVFTMDNFDENTHQVYHDLWFKKNKNTHRALSGSFWRIYYPWVNASATADNIPYAVQNILTTQFLTATGTAFQNNWKQIETARKLTQKGMWMFNTRKRNGKTQWSLQNKQNNEFLIQHATAVGDHWWQGRVLSHDKRRWDGFPEGEWFWIHPCY